MKFTKILPALAALALASAPAVAQPLGHVKQKLVNVTGANTPGAFIASWVLTNTSTGWRMNVVKLINCNNMTQAHVHATSKVISVTPIDDGIVKDFCTSKGF